MHEVLHPMNSGVSSPQHDETVYGVDGVGSESRSFEVSSGKGASAAIDGLHVTPVGSGAGPDAASPGAGSGAGRGTAFEPSSLSSLPSSSSLPPPSSSSSFPSLGGQDAVVVGVRVRPIVARECRGTKAHIAVSCVDNTLILHNPAAHGPSTPSATSPTSSSLFGDMERDDSTTRSFTFDHVFWSAYPPGEAPSVQVHPSLPRPSAPYACQSDVFEAYGRRVVDHAFGGYNSSVFVYGQTGAGKTHTMMGSPTSEEEMGLIPRIARCLFERVQNGGNVNSDGAVDSGSSPSLDHPALSEPPGDLAGLAAAAGDAASMSSDGHTMHLSRVEVSYVEIYMETVSDLLTSDATSASTRGGARRGGLRVREDPKTGPYVAGATKAQVRNGEEMFDVMMRGRERLTFASTEMNAHSSRSHALFTIEFTRASIDRATQVTSEKRSKICLVDLAGSERVSTAGTHGVRLQEASTINLSLSTLARVIAALADASKARSHSARRGSTLSGAMASSSGPAQGGVVTPHVPYRDSVLTWLLRESLGGNAKTTMIAVISPSSLSYEESVSTLRYADQAKRIVNRVVKNEDPQSKLVNDLRDEINRLVP